MANESLKANIADFFERVTNKSLFNQLKTFDVFGAASPELIERKITQEGGQPLKIRVLADAPRLDYSQVVETEDYTEAYYGSVLLAHDQVWSREFEDRLGLGDLVFFVEPVWHGLAVAPAFGANQYGYLAGKIQCRIQLLRALKKQAEIEGLEYEWPTDEAMTFNTDAFSRRGCQAAEGVVSSSVPRSKYFKEHGSDKENFHNRM